MLEEREEKMGSKHNNRPIQPIKNQDIAYIGAHTLAVLALGIAATVTSVFI